MKSLLKSKPILSFILLTFVISFTLWFLPVFTPLSKDVGYALVLLGACGPLLSGLIITVIKSESKLIIHSKPLFVIFFLLSAIVLFLQINFNGNVNIARVREYMTIGEISPVGYVLYGILFFIVGLNYSNAYNSKLKENYLKSALYEKGKLKWYAIGMGLVILIPISSYYIGQLIGLETTDFIFEAKPNLIISFFAVFFFLGGNEEFGWRGFLQKEIQKKYSPLIGVLIISFFWTLWHLPLYYNGFYTTEGIIHLLPRFLFFIPLTIIFTWLYNKSSYAMLAVLIMHTSINSLTRAFGYTEVLVPVITLLVSIYCLIDDKMWKKGSFDHMY